jgi:hypothetical protein
VISGDLMLQFWLPANIISIDGELSEAYNFKSSTRVGTTVRLGATLSLPLLPFYVRGAVPIKCEGEGPAFAGLRAGIGTNIGLPIAKLYIEADADFPLFGGSGTPDAFTRQDISLGAGVAFRF